jgi:hypothetical protein
MSQSNNTTLAGVKSNQFAGFTLYIDGLNEAGKFL